MKKKIIIILGFLAVIFLVYYFSQDSRFKKTITLEPKTNDNSENSGNTEKPGQNDGEKEAQAAPQIEVKPSDCDNNCSQFKKDNEKEYCQEICGTTSYFEDANDEGGTPDDCSDAQGIQKDYCLKDIATGNNDFKTCNEIKDGNIKKSCQNRITEDLLEAQQNSMEEE